MIEFPDVEGALITWLKNDLVLDSLVDGCVFFGVPRQVKSFPIVTLFQVTAFPANSNAPSPEFKSTIQIDVWGDLPDAPKAKLNCTNVQLHLLALLDDIQNTNLTSSVRALSATVTDSRWLPDTSSKRTRYVLTVDIKAIKI
jgi:hypothetical protein